MKESNKSHIVNAVEITEDILSVACPIAGTALSIGEKVVDEFIEHRKESIKDGGKTNMIVIEEYSDYEEKYNDYIDRHRENVMRAFKEHFLPYYDLDNKDRIKLERQISEHDLSKYGPEEYDAYLKKFYIYDNISMDKMPELKDEFAHAWLHHIHNNPHHYQYWYIKNDIDEEDRMLDMPFNYIVEMLCDWGSFYWMDTEMRPGIVPNNNAHNWYKEHGDKFGLSENTVKVIKEVLKKCPEL